MIYETIPEKFLSREFSLYAELTYSVNTLDYLRRLCVKKLDMEELNDGQAWRLGQLINNLTVTKEMTEDSCKTICRKITDYDIDLCDKLFEYVKQKEERFSGKWWLTMFDYERTNEVRQAYKNIVKRLNEIQDYFIKKYKCRTLKYEQNGTLNPELVDVQ